MSSHTIRRESRLPTALRLGLAIAGVALLAACSNHPTKATPQPAPAAGAPAITAQPASEGLNSGQYASLFVVASGNAPMTYQWFFGNSGDVSTPISGATDSIYNTPNLLLTSSYWVRVSNAVAGVNSNTATVTVRTTAPAAGDPFEDQVLVLVNQQRAVGATCGSTVFPAAGPLTMDASLQSAARLHSQDMAVNAFFSHTSLDGRTFDQRIRNAGYQGSPLAENIAAGYATPQAVMDGWMLSSGHCSNIMSGSFHSIGVGYFAQSGSPFGQYWTQDFGGN